MKNIMTEYQRELTTNNLHLVKEVIQKRIKINNLPLLAYEDFYAIGCEALCRAAMAYQPSRGEFAPLACRYIYNTLIDHVRHRRYYLDMLNSNWWECVPYHKDDKYQSESWLTEGDGIWCAIAEAVDYLSMEG